MKIRIDHEVLTLQYDGAVCVLFACQNADGLFVIKA